MNAKIRERCALSEMNQHIPQEDEEEENEYRNPPLL